MDKKDRIVVKMAIETEATFGWNEQIRRWECRSVVMPTIESAEAAFAKAHPLNSVNKPPIAKSR